MSQITEKNYTESIKSKESIWKKLSDIDNVLDVLLEKRKKAKLRKEVLGEDLNWDYSYAASECHYMFSKRRYWFKKYQKISMDLTFYGL
tara:strand:- start:636 stop:902 length:267 start_codon:yes stop_codon:yes gene_type:complete